MIAVEHAHRRRGGILIWLAMALLMIAVLLVGGGLFLAHNIKVREARDGRDVQVETPFGSVHVQHGNGSRTAAIGIPVYPGARLIKDGESASVDLSGLVGDKSLQIVAGKWETSDPIDKVQKYYEDKFPDMNMVQHNGRVEMHTIHVSGKKVISLSERNGGTEIALASVGEPKAN